MQPTLDLPGDAGATSATEDAQRERLDLQYVAEELTELRAALADEHKALREEVSKWLLDYHDSPTGDVGTHVSERLDRLHARHKMRRPADSDRGADHFPDACEGCQHYGVACPMVYGDQRDKRERIMAATDDPDDLRRRLLHMATDNGCHVLEEAIEEADGHGALLKRGVYLLMLVQDMALSRRSQIDDVVEAAANELLTEGLSPVDLGIDLDAIDDPTTVDEIKAEFASDDRDGPTTKRERERAANGQFVDATATGDDD